MGGSSDFNLKGSPLGKRCRVFGVDKKFIPAYDLKLVAGRNFAEDRPAIDTTYVINIIVNETAAKVFGFASPVEMMGQELRGLGFNWVK